MALPKQSNKQDIIEITRFFFIYIKKNVLRSPNLNMCSSTNYPHTKPKNIFHHNRECNKTNNFCHLGFKEEDQKTKKKIQIRI